MSVKLQIFQDIKVALQPLIKSKRLKTIKIWNNQFAQLELDRPKESPFNFPCCFIEFPEVDWTWSQVRQRKTGAQGNIEKEQKGTVTVTLHIGFSELDNETDSFAKTDQLIEDIYFAVQNVQGPLVNKMPVYGPLLRDAERQDTEHDRVIDWQMDFTAGIQQPGQVDKLLKLGEDIEIDTKATIDSGRTQSLVAFELNNSVEFDGTDDLLTGPTDTFINGLQDITVMGWFKHKVAPINGGAGIAIWNNTVSGQQKIWLDITSVLIGNVAQGANSKQHLGGTTLVADTFFHATLSYNSSRDEMIIYLNGIKETVTTLADDTLTGLDNPSFPITVGAYLNSGVVANFFGGKIFETAIYQATLTPLEIEKTFNKGKPVNHKDLPFSASLIHWQRGGDDTRDIIDGSLRQNEDNRIWDQVDDENYLTPSATMTSGDIVADSP